MPANTAIRLSHAKIVLYEALPQLWPEDRDWLSELSVSFYQS